ncbi:hypothetical protein OHA37_00090 [Streptomyces sp. NBC_00335]|nr:MULTISPECIES: hypothetical protein [unclassified Streptomyces]MCX5410168.1 hypothetical protein [Streptomyces sp. NBC_00086]
MSLVRGNEHRQRKATGADLTEILAQYTALQPQGVEGRLRTATAVSVAYPLPWWAGWKR